MCGIIGAVAQRNIVPILVEGLKRLEYRGYDSAGVAVLTVDNEIKRTRRVGKVSELAAAVKKEELIGHIGIAQTRWATHGEPSEANAHPHMSGPDLAIVHNGIIENYKSLRKELESKGYQFISETDTEVVVHLLHLHRKDNDFMTAVNKTIAELEGAYALGIIDHNDPDRLIAVRKGSPLIIGLGIEEHFIASDHLALLPVTQRFVFLEEGDVVDLRLTDFIIYDDAGNQVERPVKESELTHQETSKGEYRHYMLKEIFEQPHALAKTLEGRLNEKSVDIEGCFGKGAIDKLATIKRIQIVACGTSYHAGMVARYWIERLAKLPCQVEIASEFRYRDNVVEADTLFITLSQSGETADTLEALRKAKTIGYALSLTICNVPESSLVRESDFCLSTRAGAEVGVASTKAFTTQLCALLILTGALAQINNQEVSQIVKDLRKVPAKVEAALSLDIAISELSEFFSHKEHTLFLGRGAQFPIALEGSLKLKEISYIHAEAYPAGELKHGPLALIDDDMPVVAIAPNNVLLDKLLSNLQEVKARGGELIVFADKSLSLDEHDDDCIIIPVPEVDNIIAPIIYTIPLQLLAYHVAIIKGTDVDQPRNLAKSVTVE